MIGEEMVRNAIKALDIDGIVRCAVEEAARGRV